ncbi:MAG TPA: bifunctional serine/threonine-protein kinase/universal stress protein [Burkholderiales bacterium]|nr:bifunctional serine/threonine-protein kinase/universal stress protein [Burkholderiales bacterium]
MAQSVDGFVLGPLVHASTVAQLYRVAGVSGRQALPGPALIKIPRTQAGQGGEGILGFETETRVLSALGASCVPRVLAKGDLTTTPYLVLEFIEGRSLEELAGGRMLPPEEVARFGAAVADALHTIHAHEVIHLDLKPENVIVRPGGEAALIDFGMARHARYPDLLAEERRFASGSAPYISPEQVLGRRDDPRSDLFSLGVMLYEMATGALPFGEPRTLAGLRDRIWLEPLPPRHRAPAVPPWLQEVILRCLEIEPEARYQSAAHVAFDLRHPAQVPLTARAARTARGGLLAQAGRWWRARHERLGAARPPASHAPVIMVAVDTMHPDDVRHPALRQATARLLSASAEFRLICVSVIPADPVSAVGSEPGSHLEHLVRLRHWSEGLGVPDRRRSEHVIQALNPAGALLEFARNNNVDLIVLGAPGPGPQMLAWWRSVASGVTANAHCSVHVVRVPEAQDA